ncbi:MAG: PaeR7I family type II restriction endonuclease [Sterolibacteriaceae bacterium MAG5]|nr:PaeR7I family type II restriction endonuclease [Candidatus Nitricoxidireducens bremensis]
MLDVEAGLAAAVTHFWTLRASQKERQAATGRQDAGNRGAVTGGKHADGFVRLIADIVKDAGLADASIRYAEKKARTLPGYFRPSKEWDLIVVSGDRLVAAVEVKSQVGSFGNNFNNRVEEALGNATDFWAAYAKGAYTPSARPWLGYLFMLEEQPRSMAPTRPIRLEPFAVDDAFQGLSYAQRYELVCTRLVRERLYDAACFFTSAANSGRQGQFSQPNPELGIRNFALSLHARAAAFARLK